MSDTAITICFDHPEYKSGPIHGFTFFWAYYVNGFNQSAHCQACFRGSLSGQLNTQTVDSAKVYVMDERESFRYLYVCGVGSGPKHLLHEKNFHLPLEHHPGARETHRTYNGYTIIVENGVALPIPELAAGWKGLDLETTRCKNFRFAVGQFGWVDKLV